MKRPKSMGIILTLIFLTMPIGVYSQDSYDASLLAVKKQFNHNAALALGSAYKGVSNSTGIRENLYHIEKSGASTEAIRLSGERFLAELSAAQLSRVQFAIDDPEWRNWSNVDVGIFTRHGVSLEEMSVVQKEAANNLLRISLSAKGYELVENIMKTEQTLLELSGNNIRYGEEKYYFTLMGVPSAQEPWGWQLDGHHLVINYFVLGDQVVMTPVFMGAEPVITETGKYTGNSVLQEEQDFGWDLMSSLTSNQQGLATLNSYKRGNNNLSAANQDNLIIDYEGIAGVDLNSLQKQKLLKLIRVFVSNMDDKHAQVRMDEVAEYLDETYFAWVGRGDEEGVFYFRVHSPVILIEFDHQNPVATTASNEPGTPTRQHIHTVVRTPNGNDYGKDLLRQHLLEHPH